MAENLTPIRQQYLRIKRRYPNVIVFFRLGDFYETFDDDARTTSRELEIVLTARGMGKGNSIPMAGIPYHAVDNYLARLINRGYKVAICEQITKPGETRGIVQREVVRLVTPGTLVEPNLLVSKSNNFLASLVIEGEDAGFAYADITTGEFSATQSPLSRVISEIERLKPSELLASKNADITPLNLATPLTRLEEYDFEFSHCSELLLEHFKVASLDGFGCAGLPLAVRAAGGIIGYIRETQKNTLGQLTGFSIYSTSSFMALDLQTQDNLELFRSSSRRDSRGTDNSLLSVLDVTRTPMGGRMLKKWLGQPLLDIGELNKRHDAVEWFFGDGLLRGNIIRVLNDMPDMERLINRIKSNLVGPREPVALKKGLETLPAIKDLLEKGALDWLKENIRPQPEIIELISRSLVDQPPATLDEGGVIRPGFSSELDEIRSSAASSKQYLASLERQERERTGIKSLKVGYNRVFGYYIEISNANLGQVPPEYIRKQTLTNGERFYTPELKEYETRILHAQEQITGMEKDLFYRVCGQVAQSSANILSVCRSLAEIDVVSSLAEIAVRNSYVRPELNNSTCIHIKDGRHPVVERTLAENTFIANDTILSNEEQQLIILTGPNMSGKSTYLRQVALIVLMAQTGSFIPASSATIGIVDRIFTRIGAGEDLAAGKSTFMVEMTETANILNNATPRSLIILDEIGRGTSTYDGLSIARAVAEYIHNSPRLGAKTLFATHYHELVELAGFLPRSRNYNVAVSEEGSEVVFLRKIIPGGVDKSYGIHVARLAGLPRPVINRAQEVLTDLEGRPAAGPAEKKSPRKPSRQVETAQIPLFGRKSPVLSELEQIDINSLSPLEALNKLYELQQKTKSESG
ncbi:MAG: DNA mismatch repair protein MutS [Dehalococcoidales bacterium]|nr:DNA mismatch repair protein MutS [Dehalococcoidales bacterium]